jgi:hypothetical protein
MPAPFPDIDEADLSDKTRALSNALLGVFPA